MYQGGRELGKRTRRGCPARCGRGALAELPAFVVWGTKDQAFPPHFLEHWREALSHAWMVELPVDHWPQEEAPDEVVAAVRRFLEESASRRSDSP